MTFRSTHRLKFEYAPWLGDEVQGITEGFSRFRIGTCTGLWRPTEKTYDILAIFNSKPGNGHLQDVFDWFENSCKRDIRALRVLEVNNKRFKEHLLLNRGFIPDGPDDV